jgi:hypothetical protein
MECVKDLIRLRRLGDKNELLELILVKSEGVNDRSRVTVRHLEKRSDLYGL